MNTRILSLSALLIVIVSLLSCNKENNTPEQSSPERIYIGRGPEDILIDEHNGNPRILASCNERSENRPAFSAIVALDPVTNATRILSRSGEPEGLIFNPHGFYLQTVGGKKQLYIVNHYRTDDNLSSILVYELKGDELLFRKEYQHALMISPNEVCALPDGGFYFTNDMGGDNMIYEQLLNKYGGSLVYCNSQGDCRYAEEKLAFPNGLEYRDQQLYLATTRNQALYRYDIQADGSLINKYKLSYINGMDNLRWNGDRLIVAVHPDEIAFVKHSVDERSHSPSWTYAIDIHTGKEQLLYKNGGAEISGGSTALVLDGYLYISQVFGDYLLKVKL